MKTQVLEAIGETELSRRAQVESALAANDRIKYCLSLLQTAIVQADHPEQPANLLIPNGFVAGIGDRTLGGLVSAARRVNGLYRLPGCVTVFKKIAEDLRVMAAPVLAKQDAGFRERVDRFLAHLPAPEDDCVAAAAIDELTRAGEGDSFHRLVMDLHKALNAMQAELSEEHLDGAAVYGIEKPDRPMIAAFMAGLNRTAPLKFNHPGLATTAMRAGSRLIIQNDLGTTDAHVVVIHVEGMQVRIIHTDIHPERIEFLREMLKRYAVSWDQEQTRQASSLEQGAPFYLITGNFQAADAAELLAYLNFLGSRLVFLIDWNRARKQLRGFLRGAERFTLLAQAAENDIGHRGFLEAGGAKLVNRAIEETAGSAIHFGDRLCDVLGDQAAMDFLSFVFRGAMEGLRDHQSSGLIQDRVRAELQAHLSSEGKRLFQLASEQAAMIFEIASIVRDGIRDIEAGETNGRYEQLARRARAFEHSADQLVVASREATRRRPEYAPLFRLIETADNAADELEEVSFLIELLVASGPGREELEALGSLADLLVDAAQEWIKALSHASRADKPRAQEDVRDFLTAVDALFALEHRADDAERAFTYATVTKARDFRQLHIYTKVAHSLEEASDALKWAGLIARDYLLGNLPGA